MIKRYFTKDAYSNHDSLKGLFDVYKMFDWKKVDVNIKDYKTGKIIFEGHNLEFPEHYSQQACDIIASKYFYRDIDGNGTPEKSLKQVVHRMVCFWIEALIEEGVIEGEWGIEGSYLPFCSVDFQTRNYYVGEEAEILYDELVYTLLNQMWAPNSPQWFNTGLGLVYGLKGDPDDLYYFDEDGLHKSPDRYTRSQTSACFIIPVTDHLIGEDSITDHYVTETKLFKGGSGVGTNFSPLRAEGERLSSGGQSSGVMSFLLGLDRNAGAIKSGGTTRRAAKMVILDVNHPDIEEFVDWKVHEEEKAQKLISLGYEGGMNGEAYQTVSGQNSNNSVRVTNHFMDKVIGVDEDPRYYLSGRKDFSLDRLVDAHELWDKICTAAWKCADPGIQFDDKYNEWHTAPNAGRINATNPCSEFAFIDNSACNLASINVLKFYDYIGDFDYYGFKQLVHLVQLVLEASIYWGQYPTPKVAENSYKYRPTGLGLANLAALFLKLEIPYDSFDAQELAREISAVMTAQSYLTSSEIAKVVGACEGFEDNKETFLKVLDKHAKHAVKDVLIECEEPFIEAKENIEKTGVRNMQVTVMAPTGTISMAMDCASTGIEPFFSHKIFKKLSDGSMMEMVNELAEEYVKNTATCAEEKKVIDEYFDDHGTYQGCRNLTPEDEKVLETANEISPEAHVEMMAAIQPYISGSISKTVNLPNSATVEDVKKIYELAYEKGLKSISIYRDGSKGTQPLNVVKDDEIVETKDELVEAVHDDGCLCEMLEYQTCMEKEEFKSKDISINVSDFQNYLIRSSQEYINIESNQPILFKEEREVKFERVKPEGVRNSRTHTAKIGNIELYITVSYYESGKLCEIFVSSDKEGTTIKGLLSSLSKAISHMLQYGISPENIATMLRNQQYEPAGHVERHPYIKMCSSVSDLIARVIEIECGDFSRCQVKPSDEFNFNHTKALILDLDEIAQEVKDRVKNDLLVSAIENADLTEPKEFEQEEDDLFTQLHTKNSDKAFNTESALMFGKQIEEGFIDGLKEAQELHNKQMLRTGISFGKEENDPDNKEITLLLTDEEGNITWRRDDEDTSMYTGNECPVCHSHRVVINGSCELCLDCGSQSSCS